MGVPHFIIHFWLGFSTNKLSSYWWFQRFVYFQSRDGDPNWFISWKIPSVNGWFRGTPYEATNFPGGDVTFSWASQRLLTVLPKQWMIVFSKKHCFRWVKCYNWCRHISGSTQCFFREIRSTKAWDHKAWHSLTIHTVQCKSLSRSGRVDRKWDEI